MLSSSSSRLDSLPTRPPTPPREISEAVDDAISFLDDGHEVERLISRSRTDQEIPDASLNISPSSSQGTTATSNTSKKVGFSPHPHYYKIAALGQMSSPNARLLKRVPSAKDARPSKSILKFAEIPPPLTPDDLDSTFSYFSPQVPGSFAKMLQSVIHQLAGPSRASRLDAYLALNGVLKAYENFPDAQAMVQKMSIMMQFLTRDMAWKDTDGNLDTNIVTQALKLAAVMLNDTKLSAALDDDFRMFLLERSISVMEQVDAPKQLVKTHMYLLAQQRFHSTTMTSGKTDKIVTALKSIEDRCSGNNVVATRQVIYLRLLDQTPAVMLARIREWLEHVFHGMLSSVNEVRTRAIETCTRAGLVFGSQPHAAKALCEMFDTEVEEGQTYCDYFVLRLFHMMDDKEQEASVPQIWSAVVLFFRNKRKGVEYWGRFRTWLTVIQKCLNSSNLTTKYNAVLAWNRLVFAIMPDSSTTKNMKSMLKVPIIQNMDKSGIDKFSKQVRQLGLDSYCNLLHYSLRPGLSNEEHDEAWEAYVQPMLSQMVKHSGKPRHTDCRIIHGLVNGTTGTWNVNAALESTAIKPEDLPKLDPRWVRSRLGKFLKPLEPLLEAGMPASTEANAALDVTWRSLMRSVGDAGNQEVKSSNDLKQAIALLVNLFQRLWSSSIATRDDAEVNTWMKRYVSVIERTAIDLGSGPFTENMLSTTEDNCVEVAPTPSHRTSKRHSPPQSPLVILLGLFLRLPSAARTHRKEESSYALINCIAASQPTSLPRLELLSRTLSQLTHDGIDHPGQSSLWNAFARSTVDALKLDGTSTQESQGPGHALRHGVEILTIGLGSTADSYSVEVLTKLYDSISQVAKTKAGDGGVVLSLIEPFAKELVNSTTTVPFDVRLHLTHHVVHSAVWPKSRQSLDAAKKALWGVGLAPHRANTFDPYDNLYSLITDLVITAYNNFNSSTPTDLNMIVGFFSTVIEFLARSPASLLVTSLRKLQDGFALFVVDDERITGMNDDVAAAVRDTWSALLALLNSVQTKDSTLLKALEPLLAAGFSSPHKAVVNATISFWNENFAEQQSLDYPPTLEKVLRARALEADINLPGFPESNDELIPASLPDFYDTQSQRTDNPAVSGSTTSVRSNASLQVPRTAPQSTWHSTIRSPLRQDKTSSPARRTAPKSASSTPKARLRHDDSQIQFAPIESSPIPPADESQLLTERQREVIARQHQNAQMFPELSSSPMAHSTALPRTVSKRLDFKADANRERDEEMPGTPTGLPDAAALMSDDIPSSPTPSSTKENSQGAIDIDDEPEFERDSQDVPSSPPRASEDDADAEPAELEGVHAARGSDDTTVVTDFGVESSEHGLQADEVPKEDLVDDKLENENQGERHSAALDFPSDSQLPTMQLQQEEDAAAMIQDPSAYTSGFLNEGPVSVSQPDESGNNEDIGPDPTIEDADPTAQRSGQNDAESQDADENDIARVENSFIEPEADTQSTHSQSKAESQQGQQSQRKSRKRKRSRSIVYTSKKQKQQSPFKRLTSYIFGQSQEEDEDIGEEIVVASSQRSPSSSRTAAQAISSLVNVDDDESEPAGEPVGIVKTEHEPSTMPPPKRGRGRPRKSETPTSSQAGHSPAKSLKRRASTLSNASTAESHVSTSFVKDTLAPSKAKKQRGVGDTSLVSASQSSQEPARKTRRRASGVVIDATESQGNHEQASIEVSQHSSHNNDANVNVSPEEQLQDEEAAAVEETPIASPRSILARLRGALSDFRGMILGSQEEREFDDVLFELRREVHEAHRRAPQ